MKLSDIQHRLAMGFALLSSSLLISMPGLAQEDRPDFSGVWEMADFDLVVRPELNNPSFTPQAEARLAHFKKYYDEVEDDPALFCVNKGMPWSITSRARTYPTEIYQTEDHVFVLFEYMDNRRVIHLDETEMPEFYAPSKEGYSIGHWEGDTLVIKTQGLTAMHEISPYLRSEEATIVERWNLVEHPEFGTTIDIDVTVTDPLVYEKPATGHQVFMRAPEGIRVGGYNCQYMLWDKHVEQRQQEFESAAAPQGE